MGTLDIGTLDIGTLDIGTLGHSLHLEPGGCRPWDTGTMGLGLGQRWPDTSSSILLLLVVVIGRAFTNS